MKISPSTKERYRFSWILLKQLVITDFKLRYQGSALGYAWSLLRPLFMFLILFIVFAKFLRVGGGVPNFPIYLLFGIVLWTFFSDMTTQSLGSIVARGDLIRKIRIPRWLIIISASISATINLGLNLIIVMVFVFISHMDLLITSLWLPLILLQIYLLGLGVSFILATAYVKYRDVSYIWEVLMQAGFYITPILYPISYILQHTSDIVVKLIFLNPMAQAIQDARHALVGSDTDTIGTIYGSNLIYVVPILLTLLILISGVLYFKREAKNFAEDI